MSATPWIVACDGSHTQFPFGFACLRCGANERIRQSVPMPVYVAWAKNFTALHRGCQEPEALPTPTSLD